MYVFNVNINLILTNFEKNRKAQTAQIKNLCFDRCESIYPNMLIQIKSNIYYELTDTIPIRSQRIFDFKSVNPFVSFSPVSILCRIIITCSLKMLKYSIPPFNFNNMVDKFP